MLVFGLSLVLIAGGLAVWALPTGNNQAPPSSEEEGSQDSAPVVVVENLEEVSTPISEETAAYTIDGTYPGGGARESKRVAAYMLEQAERFRQQAAAARAEFPASPQHALSITYETHEAYGYTSYVVDEYHYTGGASGMQRIRTFVFDADGRETVLGHIVPEGRREALVAAVRAHLYAINGINREDGGPFVGSIEGLTFGDLEEFYLTEGELVIGFQEYDVAPGAAGAVRVRLPLSIYTDL